MNGRSRRCSALWFGLVATAALAAGGAIGPTAERGEKLFKGELPLTGKIVGNPSALPVMATRCINCHASAAVSAVPGSASARTAIRQLQGFGPALDADLLTRNRPRRGGPPSHYDEAGFCRLLQSGVDPAYVIIPRVMPRYELSADDCHALWTYVLSTPPTPH